MTLEETFLFPGRGGRKPQINIPLEKILLDIQNPRLAKQKEFADELDIIRTLYEDYDIEDLASSMSTNGYFDEEPIIVVPSELPQGYVLDEQLPVDSIQEELKRLISENLITFTVVEGNRRITTAKILTNETIRNHLGIRPGMISLPVHSEITNDLLTIPAIVYTDRKKVSPYLGVRHISGLLKWDAYAKAAYIAQNIEDGVSDGKSYDESIKLLQRHIPDRTDGIRKQYLYYRVLNEAQAKLDFDTSVIKDKFSLITLAINSPSIRTYMGVPTYKEANFDAPLVSEENLPNLKDVLTWIYGNDDIKPVLTDSRLITSKLAPVVASDVAREYLKLTANLTDAYDRSNGEKNYVVRKLDTARANISFAEKYLKYKDDSEFLEAIDRCEAAVIKLKELLSQ